MTHQEYLQAPGVSKSALDDFAICPAYYKAVQDRAVRREVTPSMIFGTALHSLVLDGKADFITKPEGMNFATTAGKLWKKEHQGKTILTHEESIEVHAAASAILKHPHASKLFGKGRAEVSLFGTHAKTGLAIKGRPDWMGERHLVDIKTTKDASIRGLSKTIANFRYHVQAAMYLDLAAQNGTHTTEFYFIAIQRGEVPLINVRLLSQEAIELGKLTLDKQMRELKECMDSGVWPDYSGLTDSPQLIDLPQWCYTDTTDCPLIGSEDFEPEPETTEELEEVLP